MFSKKAIFAILLALGAVSAYLVLDRAAPNDSWVVLGAVDPAASWSAGEPMREGLGLFAGMAASNAFVDADEHNEKGALHEKVQRSAGDGYSAGRSYYDDAGKLRRETVAFPPGPWKEIRTRVLEREVHNRLGARIVGYRVEVQGAITTDGKHWLFRPMLSGSGRGPDFSIRADLRYMEISRRLTVSVQESFHGDRARRYDFDFEVRAEDASIKRANKR